MMDVITYPCWYKSYSVLVEGAPHVHFNSKCDIRSCKVSKAPGIRLNIKTVFLGMEIAMLKIRLVRDRLMFNKEILTVVRRRLYIETVPRSVVTAFQSL